jgi:hypothetical protein
MELKGSITAGRSAKIVLVRSSVQANVTDGQGATVPFNNQFSSKSLTLPGVPVEPGQIVQVSVVFSFS